MDENKELQEEDTGNVFVCDEFDSQTIGINSVEIQWKDADTLEIKYDKDIRTFTKKQKIGDVIYNLQNCWIKVAV